MRIVAIGVLLLAPALALAATDRGHSFYRKAAEGGMTEVELGRLAQDKSSDPALKDFGAMMVKDHTAANEQLAQLAASKDVHIPKGPGTAGRAEKVKLEAMSGAHFDKDYVSNQLKAHEETQALLEKEISSGQDPDAKAFAQKILPTVQHHLSALQKIAGNMGVSSH